MVSSFYAAWLILPGFLIGGLLSAFIPILIFSKRLRDRTQNLEDLKGQILEWNRRLEDKVFERTKTLESIHRQLQETYLETVTALIEAMSAKDTYLYAHSHNVAVYAKAIAEEIGFPPERTRRLIQGCELHDLGKIAIPDSILMKRGPLTHEEFEIIKQHPRWGARILEPLTFMKDIMEMVHQEHERWDGSGYPMGLRGGQIRLEARIIAVADALDAMTSQRPYRQPVTLEQAEEELKRGAGTQFYPKVVEACVRSIHEKKMAIASHAHPGV